MYRIRTVIQYRGSPTAKRKAFGLAVKDELRGLGLFWHEKYLPLHFEKRAFVIYPGAYTRRDPGYVRKKGHDRPMVYTGAMRRQALARAEVRSSVRRASVTMRGLRAVNLHSGTRSRFDFRQELKATNASERDRFARRVDQGIGRRLDAVQTPETKVFG